ncbi:hypothetical protein BCR42DRAFT_404808 [Absidia repens]|uniref:Uncharacterized protein n=1 Tax=Absidia repens TaxID=90262 RepID=A0A1X2IWM5_9FUNG|nr:hypothetical protein BCR42DRAFT_404808 [Absidia repens]
MDNQKHRKPTTLKLKRMLHCKSNVSPLPPIDKGLGHTIDKASLISPPLLQHSTNVHSVTSPLRSLFETDRHPTSKTRPNELYQPLSPPSYTSTHQKTRQSHSSSKTNNGQAILAPCATKKSHSSTTMSSPKVATGTTTPHGRRSSSLHYNSRPLWNQPGASPSAPPPPLPSMALKKTHTDGSIAPSNKNATNSTGESTTTFIKKGSSKGRRRHSCSSTTQEHQRQQRSHMLQEAKKTPFNAVTPSCSVLFSKASPAANAALAASSSSSPFSVPPQQQQQSHRRQCPPPILSLEKSRSTPLRSSTKVKTYNVSPTTTTIPPTPQRSTSSSISSPNKRRSQRHDTTTLRTERVSERKRRQQELEDLISGRRGSTLKLSLTPKHTLLN